MMINQKTLSDVILNQLVKKYGEMYLERVNEVIEGTLISGILEYFSYENLQLSILGHLDEYDPMRDFLQKSGIIFLKNDELPDSIGRLEHEAFESLADIADTDEGTKNAHPKLWNHYDEEFHGYVDYMEFENTTWTEFINYNFVDEEGFVDMVEDILDWNFGSLDNMKKEMVREYQSFMHLKYTKDALTPAILEVLSLPENIFTDTNDIDDELVSRFKSDLIALDPSQFTLNADSLLYSDSAYNVYIDEFFPDGRVPDHLVPLLYVTSAEEASRIPDCRLMTTYRTYTELRDRGFDRSFEYVISDTNVLQGRTARYTLRDVETLLFVSSDAQEVCNMPYISSVLPDYLGAADSAHMIPTSMHIDAPGTNIRCMIIHEDVEVSLTAESRVPQLMIHDIDAVFDYLNVCLTDYTDRFRDYTHLRTSREDPLQYAYTAAIEVDIPNSVGFDVYAPRTSATNVVRSLYIDEYLESGNFTIDAQLIDALEASGIYEPEITALALNLRDTRSHAVVSAYMNSSFRVSRFEPPTEPAYFFCTSPDSRVSIIVYAGAEARFREEERNIDGITLWNRWDVLNFSPSVSRWSSTFKGIGEIFEYFGFRVKGTVSQSAKLFKNSNFMAYSYLYMFLPQIIGRFGEHIQSDFTSQTLPLGSVLSTYFYGDDAPENPRQFLERARDLSLLGTHPLLPVDGYQYRHYDLEDEERFFIAGYYLALKKDDIAAYNSPLRFMYSFIDTYTKPLAILYNALQFSSGARPNPELRTSKANITSNYPLNYSDGSWVEAYKTSLTESQGTEFAQLSQLTVDCDADSIAQEIKRFTAGAQVREFSEIRAMYDLFKTIQYDSAMLGLRSLGEIRLPQVGNIANDLASVMSSIDSPNVWADFIPNRSSEANYLKTSFDTKVVYDIEGEFDMSVFSQQLTAAITFLSRFTSFVIGTYITGDFENSDYYKIFLTGNKTDSAPVKYTVDFREFLKFPIITKKLSKIVMNPLVKSATGEDVRFTVSNLQKNLVPLDVMRYALTNLFKGTYTYSPMSIDTGVKLPKGKRMSLGAYCTIFTCLAASKKVYLGLQSSDQFGPVLAAFGDDDPEFDYYDDGDDIDFSEIQFTVRQSTASTDMYTDSDQIVGAGRDAISERLSNLSSAYQICIGQAGMPYIRQAQAEDLEVFTFFSNDSNVSTLGLQYDGARGDVKLYSVTDTSGDGNKACYAHSVEGSQFILNWLADIFLEYTLSEEDIRAILEGRKYTYAPKIEFDLDDSSLRVLFESFQDFGTNFDDDSGLRLGAISACHRLADIFEDYTYEKALAALPRLTNIHKGNFFEMLLTSLGGEYVDKYQFSHRLMDNRLFRRRKPLFRKP